MLFVKGKLHYGSFNDERGFKLSFLKRINLHICIPECKIENIRKLRDALIFQLFFCIYL